MEMHFSLYDLILLFITTLLSSIATYFALKILAQPRVLGRVFFIESLRTFFGIYVAPFIYVILLQSISSLPISIPKISIEILTGIVSLLFYKYGLKVPFLFSIILTIVSSIITLLIGLLFAFLVVYFPVIIPF